jgi:cytochrome c oxidase assembly protein subunit 15
MRFRDQTRCRVQSRAGGARNPDGGVRNRCPSGSSRQRLKIAPDRGILSGSPAMTVSAVMPATENPARRGPFRLALALIAVTVVTILKGAMTTSTGSGLAFADWPLSDGQLMPERSYTTLPGFFEHFHRLAGATAGLLSLSLALWLHLGQRLAGAGARRTAWFGLLLITVQGVVGGVGVLEGLPAATSVTHGTLAQLTLATFAWLCFLLSERCAATPRIGTVPPGSGRKLALLGLAVLVAQTVIGALARHTNSPHALWTHVGNAFVVFVVVVIVTAFAVGRLGAAPGIRGLAQALVLLLILQVAAGFVALLVRNSAGKTPENVANLGTAALISGHVLLGAILTLLMATLAAHVFRATRAAGDGAA